MVSVEADSFGVDAQADNGRAVVNKVAPMVTNGCVFTGLFLQLPAMYEAPSMRASADAVGVSR